MAKSPAVETAREVAEGISSTNEITLVGGVRAKVVPVSASLLSDVTSKIEDPAVPMWRNPDKDRDEPNPNDPSYLRALNRVDMDRATAFMDAMVMFGLELVDGLPEDDSWLKKLQMLDKLGRIDLKAYDLDDPFDREFLFKRYIAADSTVIAKINAVSGMGEGDVAKAAKSFPGN